MPGHHLSFRQGSSLFCLFLSPLQMIVCLSASPPMIGDKNRWEGEGRANVLQPRTGPGASAGTGVYFPHIFL